MEHLPVLLYFLKSTVASLVSGLMGKGRSFESGGNTKSFVKRCLRIASLSVAVAEYLIMKWNHCKNINHPSGLWILTSIYIFLIHSFKTGKNSKQFFFLEKTKFHLQTQMPCLGENIRRKRIRILLKVFSQILPFLSLYLQKLLQL